MCACACVGAWIECGWGRCKCACVWWVGGVCMWVGGLGVVVWGWGWGWGWGGTVVCG